MFGLSHGVLVVSLLLISTVLAGCADQIKDPVVPNIPDAKKKVEWTAPAPPTVDAATYLTNHAAFVSGYPQRNWDTESLKGARDHLEKAFKDAGLETWRQKFDADYAMENVCGAKIGIGEPDVWIVVGGHYDTTTWDDSFLLAGNAPGALISQGAYDDGSGTWITVELAKVYAKIDSYYSILFCAFDGEERGLRGSGQVYKAMQDSEEFPWPINYTRGMLDFDMFGICWPVRAPIYFDQNDATLKTEVDKVRKQMGIPDDMFIATGLTLGASDYQHWYGKKIPTAFFISDFEQLGVPTPVPNPITPGVPGAYPFWHWVDTTQTMMAMAGGPDMLKAGFQTALDLGTATLSIMAHHPEIALKKPAE